MGLESIKNFIRVSEGIASSGQPEADQFNAIASAGYEVVINLAMPDSRNALADEGGLVTSLGMAYVHIPVPFEAPTVDHLRRFIGVMNAFSGRRVWVHCALNFRVSAFLFQYLRLALGVDKTQAQRAILPSWTPDAVWQRFMEISADELAP